MKSKNSTAGKVTAACRNEFPVQQIQVPQVQEV